MAEGGRIERIVVEMVADTKKFISDVEEKLEKAGEAFKKYSAEQDKIVAGLQRLEEHAEEAGVVLTERFIQVVGKDAVEALSKNVEGVSGMIAAMDVLGPGIVEQARYWEDIDALLAVVKESYEKVGKAMPIKEQKELVDELEQQVKISKELQIPYKETVSNMDNVAESFLEGKKSGGLLNTMLGDMKGGFMGLIGPMLKTITIAAGIKKAFDFAKKTVAEANKEYIEATQVNFQLQAAVRQYQLTAGEAAGTQQEWNGYMEELRERFYHTREEASAVTSQIAQMGAQFRMPAEQMQELGLRAAALGETTKVDAMTSLEALTMYITQGTIPRIQGLVLNLSEAELQSLAFSKGIDTNVSELSEAEQMALRYELALQKTEIALETSGAMAETTAGRLDKIRVESERTLEGLGALTSKFVPFFKEIELRLKQIVGIVVAALTKFAIQLGSGIVGLFMAVKATVMALWQDIKLRWESISGAFEEGLTPQERWEKLSGGFKRQEESPFAEQGVGEVFMGAWTESAAQIQELAFTRMAEGLDVLEDKFESSGATVQQWSEVVQDAINEAGETIAKLRAKYEEGLAKADQRLQDRLDDIEKNFLRRRLRAEQDLIRDLQEIDEDYYRRRAQEIVDYQIEEQRALEDHLTEMKRLEQQYLMDLGDAVRERDARAVIDLTRRFKTEKKEREEDFDTQQRRREQDHQIELQRMRQQAELKKAERLRAFIEELEDLAEQERQRNADAQERYNREVRDLERNINNKLQLEAQGYADSLGLAQEYIMELYEILALAFGEGGFTEELLQRFGDMLSGAALETGGYYPTPQRRQYGGTFVATRPTLMEVGEHAEKVTVSPFLGAGRGAPGTIGGGGGEPIQINMSVDADERLVVEVAEQTMSQVADVIVSVNRKQRKMT